MVYGVFLGGGKVAIAQNVNTFKTVVLVSHVRFSILIITLKKIEHNYNKK